VSNLNKKIILGILAVLFSLGSMVSADFTTTNSTLGCFTSGTLSDMWCVFGSGFGAWVGGSSIIATIFLIFFGVAIGWKLHIPLDALALFIFFLLLTGNLALGVTSYLVWLVVIIFGVISAIGIYHWIRR
jgi:hypothetical protein